MSYNGGIVHGEYEGVWIPVEGAGRCRRCKGPIEYRKWVSSDGAYEDYHFRCIELKCLHEWWVDGDDG